LPPNRSSALLLRKKIMTIITGAAGFIGSCLLTHLNNLGETDLILVDEFSRKDKNRNFLGKQYREMVHRNTFLEWLARTEEPVDVIYHLGARTDTTEQNVAIFDELNLNYSKELWRICVEKKISLVYASSAATYGLGEKGYDDNHLVVNDLKPLNPYGVSKNDFDKWVLKQKETPPHWYGLKFFNVYGPNEYHKGRMASVIFHTVRQIKATGGMKLFRSHRSDYKDGQQSRDFVYVKDVVNICQWLAANQPEDGLYNLGTGTARPFFDLAKNTFLAMDLTPKISFIDTPKDIRETYQYFTEANMNKLRKVGYEKPFFSLEDGIRDYVSNYLMEEKIW